MGESDGDRSERGVSREGNPTDTTEMERREMLSSNKTGPNRLWSMVTAGVVLAVTTAGCSYVKRDELTTEIAQIRSEMQAGDSGVETRLRGDMASLESRMEQRIVALESDLQTLEGEFATTVERFNSAIRFNAPVHFDYDNATVRAADQPVLDRFAEVIQEYYTGTVITVEGFTDPAGSADYNRRLGEARADAVRDYLVGKGIPTENLRAVSYGEESARQVVPGAYGPTGDAGQNRRVAMVIDFAPFAASQPQYYGDEEF
jgi:peptidoglycan-associated lipoprotein